MRFEDKVVKLRIQKHGGKETPAFLADVKALTDGEAFEYLLGEVKFCDAKVDLSLRPMIPRPETEHWVKQAIQIVENRSQISAVHEMAKPFRVLDLFSGSGNVGLAVLKNIPNSTVDFIEYDPKLKEQIEISLVKNKIDLSRACIFIGDTFEPLSRQDLDTKSRSCLDSYDYIFAVPPYVPPQMKEEVMQELSAEDPLSFFDKEDGYYYHTQVLGCAKDFLNDNGVLYLEFDITQRERIEQLALENGWTNYSFLTDPYGHECAVKLVK